ncbi:MAG: hypothetical protein HQL53_10270 [Magnetococcales bacterium]|nr:hypothetical protein [Magnetococcales bacterium]
MNSNTPTDEFFIPANNCPIEITFEGLIIVKGHLLRATPSLAHIDIGKQSAPKAATCFIRGTINDQPFYTRAKWDKQTRKKHWIVEIENGITIYKALARSHIYRQPSTMQQLITSNKVMPIVKHSTERNPQRKLNCWEYSQCGKENYCLSGTSTTYDGIFGGKNGGRFCAFIEGTLCKDGIPMDTMEKMKKCAKCDFFKEIISDAIG